MSEMEQDAGTCAATVGCQRMPAPGLLICRGHLERMGALLRSIEDEAALLSAVPSMQQRTGNGGGSLASERAPARLDVLVHTDRRRGTGRSETDDDALAAGDTLPILDVLHSWARVVREERGFATRAAVTISGERDLLTRQLEWVAAQAWVDEFYTDLTTLLGQLRACNGTGEDKPFGRCYLPGIFDAEQLCTCGHEHLRHDMGNGCIECRCRKFDAATTTCGGPIWVDPVAGHAHCGRCRQTWDGPQLALLNWELEQQRAEAARPRTREGRAMLTAEELVAQGMVSSVSNVRVTAHRSGRVSVDGHYDPAWFSGKVSA